MAGLSDVFTAMGRLGVRDPKNPTGADFKMVLDAYLKDKTLDTDVFTAYVKSMSVPLKTMFEGFAQFSADSKDMSKDTNAVIKQAMQILQGELNRSDITPKERREVLGHVLRLVTEARDESAKHRDFLGRLALGMGAAAVVVAGVGVLVISRGKNADVIKKGLEMAGKAGVKALG
jgi:hypothetical protein